MAATTPRVSDGLLFVGDEATSPLAVGSPAWFAWLAGAMAFAFVGADGRFTARKERVSNGRGGWYWRAYRRVGRRLLRAYLGRSEALALALLEATATRLADEAASLDDDRDRAPRRGDSAGRGQPSAAAPAGRAGRRSPVPGNLPGTMTSFVGREQELAEVARLVTATRLLTLTGAGGCGKTRLALEVARAVAGDYPDGAWLVELAAATEPMSVPRLVAASLQIRPQPDVPPLDALLTSLRPRRLLLALDNCEHLIDSCAALVDALLRACPGVHVLATSREPLSIAGEVAWRVPSLAAPPPDFAGSAGELAPFAAVALFVERGRAALPGFRLTPHNAVAVAQICRQLDGIPLALELAAARVSLLSVEQIAARLDDRFRLLTGARRQVAPRQQTLQAAMDWSYDLLGEPERDVLRRLAAFAGGASLEAAEAVCAGGGIRGSEVMDLLGRLAAKSLAQVELSQSGDARYQLLDTVRAYAWARLLEAGEAPIVRRRHGDWCLSLAERAERALATGRGQVAWLARLEIEHENLRTALAWRLEDDPSAGLRLAGALAPFWRMHTRLAEARDWLDRLLSRAPERTPYRLRALLAAGAVARDQGDFPSALSHLEAALALGRELGDRPLVAAALCDLGILLLYLGDYGRAGALLQEGHALVEAGGDGHALATSLFGLGWLAGAQGEFRRAGAPLAESLAYARRVGDRWLVSRVLWQLGGLAQDVGDYARARTLLEDGLAIAEELAAPQQIEALRRELGDLARAQGDADQAVAHYEAALAIARRIDDRYGVARNLAGLGRAALLRGDLDAAGGLLVESLTLYTRLEYPSGIAAMLQALALVAWRRGEVEEAAARLRASLELRGRLGHRPGVAACLEGLAMMAARAHRPARAARLLGAAEALREASGAPVPPAERADYDRTVAAAHAALGETMLAAARAAGRSLTLAAAVAEGLTGGAETATSPRPRGVVSLTPRERDVLRLIARGATDLAIAEALSISVKTVNTHVANILGKLECANRTAAGAVSVLYGLVLGRIEPG
jgi:predicted ATPase/DNA-binding CsgD family transcriptional regulator